MACIGEIAVGVASAILGKIGEYTVAPVGRQLGYLFRYTTNVSELQTQLEDLNNATQRMERRVNEALNNCHEIEADVQTWQKNAEQISGEATTFLNPQTHAKALCSCGSPHHLVTRYQLSRKANKMSLNVRELVSKNKEFDSKSISFPRRPEDSSATPTKGYESFYSRGKIMKSILAAVRDGNKRIGLHGMGGIGKTMLAKEIARLAQEDKLFTKVVMSTISQTPNMKEIQQQIAGKLGLKLDETDSMDERAGKLRMRLKDDKESKILLILDDIWKELDLEEIGIHEECKMLITSRDDVLLNIMGVAESNVFLIRPLESSEAMSLFNSIIGDTKENYINDLAPEIVNECGGLPIAIATVAHALKYRKDEDIWKGALQRLKSSNLNDNVYKSIKLSYDFLGDHEKEAKPLLLLCALHKEDEEIEVEDLTRYSMGWCLLEDIYRVEDARNRVNLLVDKLKTHCLLLDGRSKSTVKMHDVIRDVCIRIAKEDHGHRMMKNIAMCEDEITKASKAISFVDYDDFDNLPQTLECPRLELLLLSGGFHVQSIPDDFFKQTGKLKVLGMNGTWLRSLPSCFRSLQNLRTLCLRGSTLEDIAVIGQLTNLKALDLSKSYSIQQLPKEIGALKHLQVLDLRKCENLRVIEAEVISNLKEMEELYLPREFEGWDEIINEEGGIRNASLMEIKSLQQLTALSLCVPSEHVLPQGLFSEKLERYHISIGVEYSSLSRDEVSSKWLGLSLSQLEQVYARELISLMRRSECLSLTGSMSVNNVSPSLVNEGFPRLKDMVFFDNDGVQCIINSTDVAFLPRLESLTLKRLRSLESICRGNKLPRGSFNQLRKVEVKYCDRLKNLFPLCVAKLLHEITVENCEMMEEIIVREDGDEVGHNIDDDHSSLQLRSLHLESLPKLVQFYCSNHRAAEESDHPKPFFSETVSFPKLEDLTMMGTNIEKLWPDQLMVSSSSSSSYMQNLTTLEVRSCNNLKYLFSFSVAQKFVNLKRIQVIKCKAMEDVIRVVDQLGEEESTHHDHDQMERIDLFPKLQSPELVGLSSLQRFCSATGSSSCMVFPLLSKLTIRDCSEMKALATTVSTQEPFFSKKVAIPKLEDLTIERMNIEKLWPDQLIVSSTSYMQSLTSLKVQMCHNLKYLFSFSLAQKFVNLKRIQVKDCNAMEDIIRVVDQPGEEETTHHDHDHMERIDLLPKLEYLDLDSLSSLQRFCSATDSSSCMVFPLLSKLTIKDCPEMKAFVSCPTQPFYSEKISFPNLKELAVSQCNNLKSLLSSAIARSLVQLERLNIARCEKMEEVIVMSDHDKEYSSSSSSSSGGTNTKAIIPFQNLRYLELHSLPNFIRFCELGDYCIECPLLSELEIMKCPKLKELFMGDKRTSSSCTINTTDNNIIGEEMDRMVSAPNKQILFKHNNKVIVPMLKTLKTDWSEGIKEIFEMSSNSIVLFPNLDTLHLICTSSDEPIGVPNLKLFLHKYHTIRTLKLRGSFVNLSNNGDGEVINNTTTTHLTSPSTPSSSSSSSLEQLIIDGADDMVDHVFGVEPSSHNNTIILLFPNLKHIAVWGCSRLQSFPPSMFFHNLEALLVSGCHGLRYLLSSSTATTLVRLQLMKISDCDKMKEIIINHNGNEEQEKEENPRIVFQNLKELWLSNLPSLQSFFYSGNKVTMSIPNLEQLSIWSCPEMRRFSDGIVDPSASLLKTIKVDGERIDVERDDVNATLAKLFREDNNKNNNSYLRLRRQFFVIRSHHLL